MASYRRGYGNNQQENRAFPRPSGMNNPEQRLELMPDYQPMQPMPYEPMPKMPEYGSMKPEKPMYSRPYGDDVRSIPAPMPEPSMPGPIGNVFNRNKQYSDNPELNELYNKLSTTISMSGGIRQQTPEESAASSQEKRRLEQAIISAGGNPYEHFTSLPHGSFGEDGPGEGYDPMTGRTPEAVDDGQTKMNRMMELLKRSAQPNADSQYTPPKPESRLEEMSRKLNPGMHMQDLETTKRVGREQIEAKEFFRNNPGQQPIMRSDLDDMSRPRPTQNMTDAGRDILQQHKDMLANQQPIEMTTKQYKGPIISQAELEDRSRYDTRPLDVQRAENAERSQKRQDMISGMPDKYGKGYSGATPPPPQMPQQMYSARPGEELEDYQDRVTAAQQADPNFNRDLYQQQLRSGQGRQPIMMRDGGSAERGNDMRGMQLPMAPRPMPMPTTGPGPQKIMERPEPRRPRMPDNGGDRSDMMRRMMEMFRSRKDAEQRPQRRGPSRQDRRQNDLIYDMPRMPQRYEEFPQRPMPQDIFTGGPEYGAPMMMSNGGSAWRGSLPQGYEADEELRAQALADFDAGADIDGDRQISDEELYNWRPSDSRYGTNPNNRVNRNQSYSQAALDTLRRKGADMGDDGVFSEDEFWKFDAARQQNEGQNYGGATLEGEFNYQDPSTWNAPPTFEPEPMPPMPPSQTTYVPEPARNPYVFGGYGSPPPQYSGMADPRMTNIVGMAPPSYYGGAEE